MKKSRLSGLFIRFYTRTLNRKEEKELLNTESVDQLMAAQWEQTEEIRSQSKAPDFDALFRKIEDKAYKKQILPRSPLFRIAAAVLLLLAISSALFLGYRSYELSQSAMIATNPDETKSFTLPDGSRVVLSGNSQIRYSDEFTQQRTLELQGKAFFEVKKGTSSFVVNSYPLTITVTGTSFSVENFEETPEAEIILVEGSILLNDYKGSVNRQMKPNERIVYQKESQQLISGKVDAISLTHWQHGKVSFDNSSLHQIAGELQKRYGKTFRVEKEVADFHFTFSISQESLEETLRLIHSLAPVNYTQVKDTVTFHKQP